MHFPPQFPKNTLSSTENMTSLMPSIILPLTADSLHKMKQSITLFYLS